MKKQLALLLLLVTSLTLTGCKKDEEVNATLAEFDSFTTEMVKRVESAPNPAAGLDEAQTFFDSKKADITAKMETLKALRGYQVGDETKQKMMASLVADATKVGNLEIEYINLSVSNPAFKAKLDKLVKDYQTLFGQ